MPDPQQPSDLQDERWGGYMPWFLRHPDRPVPQDVPAFCSLLRQRLERLLRFNEARLANTSHFGSVLVTESLGWFTFDPASGTIDAQVGRYFSWGSLHYDATLRTNTDPETRKVSELRRRLQSAKKGLRTPGTGSLRASVLEARHPEKERAQQAQLDEATLIDDSSRQNRYARHLKEVLSVRLWVLEVFLRNLPSGAARDRLVADVRRIFAAVDMPLDLKGDPPIIVLMDEPLLQREVIDRLLPRLLPHHADVATDLIKTYHDFAQGGDGNKLLGDAYKALEKLARRLSSDESLLLSEKKEVQRHFPALHPTVRAIIDKLAAHAGDEGRHGGKGPDDFELRYLLSHVCNTALLLVEACGSRNPAKF